MTNPISLSASAQFSNISKGDLMVACVVVVIINKLVIQKLKKNTFTQIQSLSLDKFENLENPQKSLENNNNRNIEIVNLLERHNQHKFYSLITYCALFVFSISRHLFPCQYIAIVLGCIDWIQISANTSLIKELSNTCVIKNSGTSTPLTRQALAANSSCKVLITDLQKSTVTIWKYEVTSNNLETDTACTGMRPGVKLDKTQEQSKHFN